MKKTGLVRYPLEDFLPELAQEYSSENTYDISEIGRGSNIPTIWLCHECHKPFTKTPAARVKLYNKYGKVSDCTHCGKNGRHRLGPDYNFEVQNPTKAVNWDYEKNSTSPSDHTQHEKTKIHFKCQINRKHTWSESLTLRTKATSICPICSGHKVGNGFCLADNSPEIAKEWHKDNDKTPSEVRPMSTYKAKWQCDNPDHKPHDLKVWQKVSRQGKGCRICNPPKNRATENYNLETENPDIAKQWHPTKNDLLPTMVTPSSKKKVWWYCDNVECKYEWDAYIYNRTGRGDPCPECSTNQSKGEKAIREFLNEKNINNKDQYQFPDLIGTGGNKLQFDHGILSETNDVLGLIEFNGAQHYVPVAYDGSMKNAQKKLIYTQTHDKLKAVYCNDNDIPLLVIRFDQFDELRKLVLFFLNRIGYHILPETLKTNLGEVSAVELNT